MNFALPAATDTDLPAITVAAPSKYKPSQLMAAHERIFACCDVGAASVTELIANAHFVAMLALAGDIVAVGVVTRPRTSDLERIKERSGFDVTGFTGELGHVCVAKEYRRRGFGDAVTRALGERYSEPLFATTSELNGPMQAILTRHRFKARGTSWPSPRRDPLNLVLWVRPPA
jgi:ribosomal protein S18 acetylase RimI-like enzyme